MKNKLHGCSKRFGRFFIMSVIVFLIILTGCNKGKTPDKQTNKDNRDSVSQPRKLKDTLTKESVIYILSLEGKLLREVKYSSKFLADEKDRLPDYFNEIKNYPSFADTLVGDFNGDGKMESCWIAVDSDKYDKCREENDSVACQATILFSDKRIKPLVIDWCPWGSYNNEGDLNWDGKDEIGVLPGWFFSSCREYEVYSYINNKWKQICEPVGNTLNMREAGIDLIDKNIKNPEFVIIRESVYYYYSSNPVNNIPAKYSQGSCCQWSNVVERSIPITKWSVQHDYVDPTGTYNFVGKTQKIGEDIYGAFGTIQVKRIEKNKLIMTFIINLGATGYNSGSFVDTLLYDVNKAVYTTPEWDPSCKITFSFNTNGVYVLQKADDINCSCGFGHGVTADGYYKKISSCVPILKDPTPPG